MSGNAAQVEFRNSYAAQASAKKHSCDVSAPAQYAAAMLALRARRIAIDKADYPDDGSATIA